ncbi:hypothetical protein AB7W88_16550 [Providencia vermicola]|uniref:hypothetical protein n=1 Tax=Providencia TaxID=586 RepID=UPI0034E52C99
MTFHEFISFLLPGFDIIQMMFGGMMLFLVLLTIGLLWRQANHKYWEQKWQGSATNNTAQYLDVKHGAVSEISNAVASPAEKIADIMPGILLILGLLGTFLGLGIALNKASDILIDANSAGMDSAMSNLMGMMEGLGTKFKTSTWGIIAYLILKGWTAFKGYDDQRLRWCAQKMKLVFDQSRQDKLVERERTQQLFLNTLQNINGSIKSESYLTRQSLDSFSSGMKPLLQTLIDQGNSASQQNIVRDDYLNKLCETLKSTQQQLKMESDVNNEKVGKLNSILESLRSVYSGFEPLLNDLVIQGKNSSQESLKHKDILVKSCDILEKTQQQLISSDKIQRDLNNKQLNKLTSILDSFNSMHSSFEPLLNNLIAQGEESSQQSRSYQEILIKLGDVLDNTQQELISTSLAQTDLNKQQLNELAITRESLKRFIDTNSDNLIAIQSSAENMADAAKEMGDSAEAMGESAGELQNVIGDFRIGITDMLGTVKTDLGSTINNMGDSFSHNMSSISSSMANATDGISNAVTALSQNVGSTMSDVRISIDQSMKTQRDAQREFMITSETLNEKVIAMTKLVDDLREQIINGLSAVSGSNRQVASLNNRYEQITDFVEKNTISGEKSVLAIESLVQKLNEMQNHSPMQPSIDAINNGVSQLLRSIDSLRTEISTNRDASTALSSLDEKLINTIKELSMIRDAVSSLKQAELVQKLETTLKPMATSLQNLDHTLAKLNKTRDIN